MEYLARRARAFNSKARSIAGTIYGGSVIGDPLTRDQHDSIKGRIPPPISTKQQQSTSKKSLVLESVESRSSILEELPPPDEESSSLKFERLSSLTSENLFPAQESSTTSLTPDGFPHASQAQLLGMKNPTLASKSPQRSADKIDPPLGKDS